MENLAMVANNPDMLPCYSVVDAGTATITDTYGLNALVTLLPNAAGNGSFDPNAKRQIGANWVLSQVTGPEKLRALHLAFMYGVYYDTALLTLHDHRVTLAHFCLPSEECTECQVHPLATASGEPIPAPAPTTVTTKPCIVGPKDDGTITCDAWCPGEPGYYFAVAHELQLIPHGWLHVGAKTLVSPCARFVAHCCDTYVWVDDVGMEGLSRFTLAIQHIARTPAEMAYAPQPYLVSVKDPAFLKTIPVILNCQGGTVDALTSTDNTVFRDQLQLPIDCYGNIVIQKVRGDSIQTTDSKLKSALTGIIKSQ
jgi:hypothetical protein